MAVTYYVGTNPQDTTQQGLVRVVDRLPGLESEEMVPEVTFLSEKVRSLNVRYFDPFQKEWLDEWQEATYFPTSVMVTIGVEREGGASDLLYMSNVTSLPMGGEAPEDILDALEETQEAAMEGQMLEGGAIPGGSVGAGGTVPRGGATGRSTMRGGGQ
jgi:hypothetical protein